QPIRQRRVHKGFAYSTGLQMTDPLSPAGPAKQASVYAAEMSRVYALSFHADYQCERSGVCCTSDWDVPVEVPLYRTLSDLLQSGNLCVAASGPDGEGPLIVDGDLPDETAAMVARTSAGDCVFYHRDSGLCVIQRDAGEAQLPSTCRHFPRLAVRDWRGTFIS